MTSISTLFYSEMSNGPPSISAIRSPLISIMKLYSSATVPSLTLLCTVVLRSTSLWRSLEGMYLFASDDYLFLIRFVEC